VIGGLIKKSEKLTDNKVPFLGNVPLIGYLFKSRDKTEIKTELVIVLQPVLL
jgi:type II secretory pathway component HofQ